MLKNQEVSFAKAIWPLAFFFAALIYGLFIQPVFLKESMLPFEVLILMAITFCGIYLLGLGYSWKDIHHHMTCLLYTSPSPRDATLSRMPSSA